MKPGINFWAISVLLLTSCHGPDHISVLVPENFTGQVFILYNQADCEDEINGDTLILRVPESGIVKTSSTNPTWNMNCYYSGKDGNRTRIKWYSLNVQDDTMDDDTTSIHCMSIPINYDGDAIQSFFVCKPLGWYTDQTDSLRKTLDK